MLKKRLYSHKSLPEMYHIDVSDNNTLYVETSGNKKGIPIIFLHGGPGGNCRSDHHTLFNPDIFRSIIFDQRGCGKSRPYRSTENNTTQKLIEDIEIIRNFFKIDKFIIVGGSWGATLALSYAQTFPKFIKGIILRSVFLGTMNEIFWAFLNGPKIFTPELHQSFIEFTKEEINEDVIKFYVKKIKHEESILHSWIWHDYERILSQIQPEKHSFDSVEEIKSRIDAPVSPLMECHYIENRFFMDDNQILNHMSKLNDIPGYIIQGRYDLICPPHNAYSIHKKWSRSNLKLINTAGHSSTDEGITENLLDALERIVKY